MATALDSASSDREEGEIIDEFEDISDNSIILPGKCDSSKDHLPVISLSSVSEDESLEKKHHHRIHGHHHHHHHHGKMFKKKKRIKMKMKKKFRHHRGLCSDSNGDSNDYTKLDSKLLKAAIRVNDQECLKNSLRSRLKGMTNSNDCLPSDNQDEGLPSDNQDDIVKLSNQKVDQEISSDEGDDELIQLRLEALRTAVLNKFQRRKKRKMKETNDGDNLSESSIKTDDKENNEAPSPNLENVTKKSCLDLPENDKVESNIVENNILPEDDEDVLRALLLASIAKKITKEPTNDLEKVTLKTAIPLGTNNPNSKPVVNQSNTKFIHNCPKRTSNSLVIKTHKVNKSIRNANFPIKHTKVKPIIININGDSDSDDEQLNKTLHKDSKKIDVIESTVEKFLKEQRAKVEAAETPCKKKCNSTNSEIFQKSAVKLLPKVKQIEYQNLLLRLKEKREQKPRVKRNSHKSNGETKQIILNNSKKVIESKANDVILCNNSTDVNLSHSLDIADDARALQKAIKEMQAPANGRLQMQAQYKVLTPIVKKIDDASVDRKKYNRDVKRLLEELTEAKKKLKDTHENFRKYVHELLVKKEEIDKSRLENSVNSKELPITSTPLRDKNSFQSFNTSSIPENAPECSVVITDNVKDGKFDCIEINLCNPNDIDKIYNNDTCPVPEYISPLDNINRANIDDPFLIMCPYDIDGNCRDPDCVFQHYRT